MILRSMRRTITVLAVLTLLSTAACESLTGPEKERKEGREALAAARRTWSAQGLQSYDYRYQRSCFCIPDGRAGVVVNVRGGRVTGAFLAEEGTPIDPVTAAQVYLSVDGLFDLLEEAYDEEAEEVRVAYDSQRGYPTSVFIDRSHQIADEEIRVETSALVPR